MGGYEPDRAVMLLHCITFVLTIPMRITTGVINTQLASDVHVVYYAQSTVILHMGDI